MNNDEDQGYQVDHDDVDLENTSDEWDGDENEYDTEDSFIDDSEAPRPDTAEPSVWTDLADAEAEDELEQQQGMCCIRV